MEWCARPMMGEPGQTWGRSCGDCPGCRGAERHEQARVDGLVAIELQPELVPRLLELVRTPLWHRGGDDVLRQAVEHAVAAFDKQLLEAAPA